MTSPSDRDLAQQWLADVIDEWRMAHWVEVDGRDLAPAILDTPGVQVGTEPGTVSDGSGFFPAGTWIPWYRNVGIAPTHRRWVISLPVEPTQRTGEAAHQHDEEGT